jgi:Bacteriocin class II with double-glycine leader peptide
LVQQFSPNQFREEAQAVSRQSMLALLERVELDDEFRTHTLSLPLEQRKEFVLGAGYDIDPNDLVCLRDFANIDELSEEDLDRVAGGGTLTDLAAGASIGGAAGIAAVVAIAAGLAI